MKPIGFVYRFPEMAYNSAEVPQVCLVCKTRLMIASVSINFHLFNFFKLLKYSLYNFSSHQVDCRHA